MFYPSLLLVSSDPIPRKDLVQILTDSAHIPERTPLEHPDLFLLSPLEGKTLISIDQIHDITGRSSFFPVFLSKTLIVIHPADLLSLPAQQALLKVVEEPPEHAQFIFVTSRPYVLLPTILSRCLYRPISIDKQEKIETSVATPTSYSDCLQLADRYSAKREDAKELLLQYLVPNISVRSKNLALTALKRIHVNANVKLTLDTFFFSLYRDMMTLHSVKP
jgi:hypothetical protein